MRQKYVGFIVVALVLLLTGAVSWANHSAVIITGDTPAKESKSGLSSWKIDSEDPNKGYDEFWNDTYLMWELLYKNKGWANNDIYVLYGNGDDYTTLNDRYKASVQTNNVIPKATDYRAYYTEVANIFSWLANGNAGQGIPKMTVNDFLFGYTFNHGGTTGNNNSTLGLMDVEITDTDFANKVNPIPCWARAFWMQQCFSGGFIDNLQNSKTMVSTACTGSESAYRADNISRNESPLPENETYNSVVYNHGEYNFHIMNSQRGKALYPYHLPYPVNADYNGNGKVSLYESKEHERWSESRVETPMWSDPSGWGPYLYLEYGNLSYKAPIARISAYYDPYANLASKVPAGDTYINWSSVVGTFPVKTYTLTYDRFRDGNWVTLLQNTTATSYTFKYFCPYTSGTAFKVSAYDGKDNTWSNTYILYPPNPGDPIVSYSTTPEATAHSNGKKLVIDNSGKLHVVFTSNDTVYHTTSVDDGETWSTQSAVGQGKNPAIELTASQTPTICWSKGNELYNSQHSADVWGAPQLIYTGPAGSVVSYLAYVLDRNTNNSYLGWVDEGAAGSSVLISPYTPGGSGQLAPSPIDQGGADAFKSPSLALDRTGKLKITWSHNGRVYYYDQAGQLELGENGIHPIVETYGDRTSVVWQEEIAPGVYQIVKRNKGPLGWNEKQVISYPDEKNADFPVVAANGQYVYSKNTAGKDYDIVWHGEYDNGWTQYERNISYASGGLSKYPSACVRQLWPQSKLYILWTEDLPDAKAIIQKPVKIYAQEIEPVPYYYADLGTEEASVYTIQKEGVLIYGQTPDLTVDYHSTQLKYSFSGLDPARSYMLKAVYYHETSDRIQQKMKIDGQQFDVANLKPKEKVEFKRWLMPKLYSDGQIDITIDKQKGEYAVCAVLSIEEYEKDCDNTKDGGAQATLSETKIVAHRYELLPNSPNPASGQTTFRYQLAQSGKTTFKVYNTLGQAVKTIVDAYQQPGVYSVNWDGKDTQGKKVANGVYFYRINSGEFDATKKMVILK
ncbi:MAG: hypothetical protein A3K15_01620 [Candidatus Edwardsbacteria bacterium GWE2_54_12]|nr:MAG: hypothetical protein A3K15_01620 [Candidatus Edwardsbacteria bacterium GWE2_54_12]HBZ86084.1 hypothetical protein [Candidatus Edwardsbacteria bacterium]